MLLAGSLSANEARGTLVSVFDISALYAERTAQLHRFWRLCAALLCAAAALTLGFTTFLLRPLKRLSAAAARIAAGQYGQRTNIQTQDEAGTLSRDFDAMAASVQNAMENLAEEVRRRDDFCGRLHTRNQNPHDGHAGATRTFFAAATSAGQHAKRRPTMCITRQSGWRR